MKEIKYKKRQLNEAPAVLVAAFGTTTSGSKVYDKIKTYLKDHLENTRIIWAFTSEIIREKTGDAGVLEALATLEAEGYRKVIIQPLHIFPATEYRLLENTCHAFPGVRVAMGEALLHRWHFVKEVFQVVANEFIPPSKGINLIVAHGTPLCTEPVNGLYRNLDDYLTYRYDNVFFSTLDGMPDKTITLKKIKMSHKNRINGEQTKVRIIPLMLVTGLHVIEDLLEGKDSYRCNLEEMGYAVDWATCNFNNRIWPKGLGLYDEISGFFLQRIKRSMELMTYY